jgi:hypothetical protein
MDNTNIYIPSLPDDVVRAHIWPILANMWPLWRRVEVLACMRTLNSAWRDFVDSTRDYMQAKEEWEEECRIEGLQAWNDFYNDLGEEEQHNLDCWSP